MDIVYARYRKDQTNTILWQPLEDHLRHAACRASEVLQGAYVPPLFRQTKKEAVINRFFYAPQKS